MHTGEQWVQQYNMPILPTSASEVALYINKSQGMALSAGANIIQQLDY